jgi:hypothetical protein
VGYAQEPSCWTHGSLGLRREVPGGHSVPVRNIDVPISLPPVETTIVLICDYKYLLTVNFFKKYGHMQCIILVML